MGEKWLKKYTKICHLWSTLENHRIFMSDGNCWDDKNDTEFLEIYKKKKGYRDIRVNCLTMAPDRFHFWKNFGCEKKGVCLWFKKEALIEDIEEDRSLCHGKVQCLKPSELSTGKVDMLPFYKRKQYKDECEYRVFRSYETEPGPDKDYMNFSPNSLKRIYFNSWLTESEYFDFKDEAENVLRENYSHVDVRWNRTTSFKKWLDIANNLKC